MTAGNELLQLAWLVLLPAAGMLCGALAAEWWRPSQHAMGALLHAAAGVAVAVVSVELMPRILEDIAPWQLVLGFLFGAAGSVAMVHLAHHAASKLPRAARSSWKVYLPVAIDMAGDGLMIGIGSAVDSAVGLTLALSQVIGNMPGGFVAVAELREKEVARSIRMAAAASLVIPVLAGAGIGFWLLRGQPTDLQNMALALVVGMLLLATVEDLVPEADAPNTRRIYTTASFATGFAFFVLLALYMGGRSG